MTHGIIIQNPNNLIKFHLGTLHFSNSKFSVERIEHILYNGCDMSKSNIDPINYQYLIRSISTLSQSMVGFTLPMVGLAYSDHIVIIGKEMSSSSSNNSSNSISNHMYTLSREYLSHNLCVDTSHYKHNQNPFNPSPDPAPARVPISLEDKELMYQLSLWLHPWNIFALKNYGFHLEWQGKCVSIRCGYGGCCVDGAYILSLLPSL